ncbi:DUF1302 domain-containing protein [Paraglaciecola sp.]|uniref:DUF1302 domain-containing protein n=1 Tax=Paraglaciecola sp. TaxID=1920173 RepID=UPI0030F41030
MIYGASIFKKSTLAFGIASVLSIPSMVASAANWNDGDWSVSFDSNFSFGTSIRVEEIDFSTVGNSNQLNLDWSGYNPATNPIYSSADVWGLTDAGYSTNGDLGDLNYDNKKPFSTLFKGVHELDLRYKDMGVFIRGMYFYDFEMKDRSRAWTNPITGNKQDPCGTSKASEELCSDIRLLDAFFYADLSLADKPISLRIGQQVISWGESTFIQHGINTINPVDVTRAQAPGAELKEVFIPVGTVFASIDLTETFSVSAYYQYEWERSRLPQAGSYFSTNDFAGEGGQAQNVQLGFSGNPDIDLEFLLAGLNQLGSALKAGANPATIGSAYLAYPTKVAVRGFSDKAHIDASNQGQYGLKLTYFAEELNFSELSFYLINYHSQRPLITGTTSNFTAAAIGADLGYLAQNVMTKDNITDLQAFTKLEFEYPEDIKLYGFSFNTNVGETALAGEISYRVDEPLQIDDVELLYAAMPQQLAIAGLRPDLAGISQLDGYLGGAVGPGQTAKGYLNSDTMQIQATATHIFGPMLGTDNLVVLGEVGYVNIMDFPDPNVIRLNGPGSVRTPSLQPTADGNPRTGLHVGLSDGPELNPFPTKSSWGYRLLANASYNNVFAGINMQARVTFAHDVNGITPDPLFLFIEERKSASASVTFDYLSKWSASLGYNSYWGGVGTTNALSDRDFMSFNVKYSI